jgi:hypothetical protein
MAVRLQVRAHCLTAKSSRGLRFQQSCRCRRSPCLRCRPAQFKGYPFYVRASPDTVRRIPPLDTIDDGGLPRHVIVGGEAESVETRLDFNKEILVAEAKAIPETGTPDEIAAMNFHAQKQVATFKPDGTAASFALNGLPPKPGCPVR